MLLAQRTGSAEVHGCTPAGALNFKDVMLAYGKLNRDMMSNGYVGCKLGFEFSGLLAGRRIMGVAKQAIATHVFARDYLVSLFWLSPCMKSTSTAVGGGAWSPL